MIPGRFRQESRQYCVGRIYAEAATSRIIWPYSSILFSHIPHAFPCPAYFFYFFFENADAPMNSKTLPYEGINRVAARYIARNVV